MDYWKKCSICKKEIPFESEHYVCSVSTCNRKKTGLVFCCMSCFNEHLAFTRHRDAGAFSEKAPSKQQFELEQQNEVQKEIVKKETITQKSSQGSINMSDIDLSGPAPTTDVLLVASKVKKYIKERADFNTSGSTMEAMTKLVTKICDKAIERAAKDGRKTVMDRDLPNIFFD
jgi:hypothetical protein